MPSPLTSPAARLEISTPRLWLLPYTPEMAPEFWQLLDQNRARLLPDFPDRTSAVITLPDAQNRIRVFMAQHKIGDLYSFGIWRKEPNEYVGDITLRRLARGKPYSEVGYYLGDKAEGHGYATEALKAIARYAFQDLRMESINLRCAESNERSRRVAERSGFTHLKTYLPQQQDANTPPFPIRVYQLKKGDANATLLWEVI
ncbi:GNAT family N-acetyltransferase [Rufibacter sediminis]|uniref:GNAT family N-acetyltransferase n=1 Tax=Rufibacter sediminis TaxID=2762756 RepID=A0ABR6VXV0_9BACT|nr:GNAT family N-acetyltransferase [Rufibacter sediminis]MBC3542020.1 GNAT family N-acetyltransferase [Rufibacter sediminis]